MRETQRGTVSSNSRFQAVLFQQYSANLSFLPPRPGATAPLGLRPRPRGCLCTSAVSGGMFPPPFVLFGLMCLCVSLVFSFILFEHMCLVYFYLNYFDVCFRFSCASAPVVASLSFSLSRLVLLLCLLLSLFPLITIMTTTTYYC